MCGTSRWKAAKAASKTMRYLDETGAVIAGCCHVIAQKAVNMFRGEMYVRMCRFHHNILFYTDMDTLIFYICIT